MTDHDSAWLSGFEPAPGKLARASIRTVADVRRIERFTPAEVLPAPTLYECIRAAAKSDSAKPAIIHLLSADPAVPPRVVTYAQLVDSIERAASLFRELSGSHRPAVGIILPMVPEALIAAWAAATAGVAIPINPYLEFEHVVSLLNAARATVLVIGCARHGRGIWDRAEALLPRIPTLRKVLIVDADATDSDFATALASRSAGLTFAPAQDPYGEATYLPTGGTTAAPKLVRMTHRGQLLMAWLIGAHAGSRSSDAVGHAMPNFHVGGANLLALRAALYGQTLVTLTSDGFRNSEILRQFWIIARKYSVTSLIATPATAAALLGQPDAQAAGHSIRTFNCGGSTIPVDVLRRFHKRFGVWLREIWGMSEFHGMVSIHPDIDSQPLVGSVGCAVPWHRIEVVQLDAANRFVRACAPGERGILIVSGAAMTPGYLEQRFDADLFVTGLPDSGRWANTGDLGTIDERGHVWILGRAKDIIIRGGHNIDPKMIEDVLARHPLVQIAAAIGRPDAAKGEMPIAFVQLKPGATTTAQELLELCRQQVQERAAVPVQIQILAELPMTAVGKVNKPVLRAQTILGVVREQAAEIIGSHGTYVVDMDESAIRSRVKLHVHTTSRHADDLREQLAAALGRYEFESLISVTA